MTTPLVPRPPLSHAWDPAWDNDPAIMPDYDNLVVEDGKPVDNLFVEKQYSLLTDPLYTSWAGPGEGRPFMATANVGWFYASKEPPFVPDVMLILDVKAKPPREKEGRSYFQWVHGKQPDVLIEIVSDKRGGEGDLKLQEYARLGVPYYVIFDPDQWLKAGTLRAFELSRKRYKPSEAKYFEDVGLGLVLWQGTYQGAEETWLRWCDKDGKVIPTGAERAESAEKRAESAEKRAERLAEQLRKLGVEPGA
jgi:Uma2 family endonuclease